MLSTLSNTIFRVQKHALTLVVILGFLFCHQTVAQHIIPWHETIWNDDFSAQTTHPYYIQNNSEFNTAEGIFVLNPSEPGVAGRIFLNKRRDLNFFDLQFDAFFGDKSNNTGADGIVAVFSPEFNYPTSFGEELNFNDCGGYGIEFDTYQNPSANDPSEEHIGLILNRTDNHLHTELFSSGELEDNQWHTIRIINANGQFKVLFDGQSRFAYNVENFSLYRGYFGFSSATASAYNPHYLDNIRLRVPSRTSTDFGVHSVCTEVRVDTVIELVNNLLEGKPLQIDSIRINPIAGTGFSISSAILPKTLAPGEALQVPVKFVGETEGFVLALFTAFASSGERIHDTLKVTLQLPEATWSERTVTFPKTHLGTYSEYTLKLINTGISRVFINQIDITWDEYKIISPERFPAVIPPGDTIDVVVRFTPETLGVKNALLTIENSCGRFENVLLSAEGFQQTLQFGFEENLMLLPGKTGKHFIHLESDPTGLNVNELSVYLWYDFSIARYLVTESTWTIFPANSTFESTLLGDGVLFVYLWSPRPLDQAGPLFAVEFQNIHNEFACSPIRIDTVITNPTSEIPGIPFTRGDTSTICINASCRVPGGLKRIPPPQIAASPNPFSSYISIHIEMEDTSPLRVKLIDTFGRNILEVFDGIAQKGKREFTVTTNSLPNGMYFIVTEAGGYTSAIPVIHQQ